MIRRQFLSLGILGGSCLLGISGCSTINGSTPLITELKGKLKTAPMFWTNIMLQATRSQNLSPLIASRSFAMAHYSGYLAMTGDGLTILENAKTPSKINKELVYGIAFSEALEEALNVSLIASKREFLSQFNNQAHKSESILWAKSQAKRVIKWRTQDGSQESLARIYPKEYTKQNGALSWSPTGPFYGAKNGPGFNTYERGYRPAWGQQKTWLIKSVSNYEAKPFPELGSNEFKRQFEKVSLIGDANNKERTPEQNEIALFWEDGLMGITVPGHFQLIAMQLLAQRNINSIEQAKLFALLSLAQADAGIVAWHNKYLYDIIRPETAIRFADSRFSKQTTLTQQSDWQSYIPTPPFPAYVSGHSVFGAASCSMMAAFFGSDKINLTSPAPDMVNWPQQLRGIRRHYHSLRQISEENGISREYGGVHWEVDNTEGLRLGDEISLVAKQKQLLTT